MKIDWESYLDYIVNIRHLDIEGSNFDTYKSRFTILQAYFSNKELTGDNCERFKTYLKIHEYANATVNNYVKLMHAMADYLKKNKAIDLDTYEEVKSVHYMNDKILKDRDILTPDEIKKIATVRMQYGQWNSFLNYKWKVIFLTLGLGLRISELCGIRWEHVSTDYLDITKGKTVNSVRRVPLPKKLDILINRLKHYEHGYVFGSHKGKLRPATVRVELQRRMKRLGIKKKVTPHTFRYSLVTYELERGTPIDRIMRIVGHKKAETTLRYAQTSFSKVKKVIDSNPLYSSNAYEKLKELLKDKIDSVHNVDRLKALNQLLNT